VSGGAQEEHALLVRPVNGAYQIIPGWHRWTAAGRVGLHEFPCWVRDYEDEAAFMQLMLCNAQGELSPLELRIHVLQAVAKGGKGRGNKGGIRAYAEQGGKNQTYLGELRRAAEVFRTVATGQRTPDHDGRHAASAHVHTQARVG
jgi:ParB-like chromosome segregation protein Spo0J